MNVLGLFGFGMNPGACLLQDGRLVAFAEEERFNRIKTSPGLFPGRSVAWCLRESQLELSDVDHLAFAWDASKYPYRMLAALARQYLRHRRRVTRSPDGGRGRSTILATLSKLLELTPTRLREEIRLGLRAQGLIGELPPIEFVPHHLCHSYSAYFCSPFREAIVLAIDGSGEDGCTQIAVGRGERLSVERTIPIPHSLGWFYAAFTAYLGFTPYRHEGKLMALAGLGHERRRDNPWPERLSTVLSVEDGAYEVDPIYTRFGAHSHAERFTDALADFICGFDPRLPPLTPGEEDDARRLQPEYVDLAWGVQARLEEAALAVAGAAARAHGIRDLCVSGGVGLNCKMNGALRSEAPIERVFVQPASHDAGAAIGAAMVVAEACGDPIRNPLDQAGLGPSWSSSQIRTVLDRCRLPARACPDLASRVAEELEAGKLVGWFQGRMELGPRALGSRSILADPRRAGVSDELNRQVKSREPWRPFCPSILEEFAPELLESSAPSPFMTIAFEAREEQRELLSSAMHVDGSLRPQTVSEDALPLYHRLISDFHGRTGVPFLINTSFNVAGEPIACTPIDALRCFYSTGRDVLAIGDFVLTKT